MVGDCSQIMLDQSFTLYQHKVLFDPPLDYAASKFKLLTEFAEYSPSIFDGNGDILYMTRAAPLKNRIGRFESKINGHDQMIIWTFKYIGLVNKESPLYHLFRELIFLPGLTMKIFNTNNSTSDVCKYEFDKRFQSWSATPYHAEYAAVIRMSDDGDVLHCSEFKTEEKLKENLAYQFVQNDTCSKYLMNARDYLMNLFEKYEEQHVIVMVEEYLIGKKILAPYNGKVYIVGGIAWKSSPLDRFKDRNTGELVRYKDHYQKKYGIELRNEPMILAFPTKEDIFYGKYRNIYLSPRVCYILKNS